MLHLANDISIQKIGKSNQDHISLNHGKSKSNTQKNNQNYINNVNENVTIDNTINPSHNVDLKKSVFDKINIKYTIIGAVPGTI